MYSDAASIQVLDPVTNRLKLTGWRGFHPDSAKFWDWVRADTGSSCSRALEAGERIVVPDMDSFDGDRRMSTLTGDRMFFPSNRRR